MHDKGTLTYENSSLLKTLEIPPVPFAPWMVRAGVIAKKLGEYPLWLKNGKQISTTVLQVGDNHVVKYIPPGLFSPMRKRHLRDYSRKGCLLVGAESIDPNILTANYIGLFKDSGVMPKSILKRFIISPEAALPAGTQLNVTHFKVGDYVDVRGLT